MRRRTSTASLGYGLEKVADSGRRELLKELKLLREAFGGDLTSVIVRVGCEGMPSQLVILMCSSSPEHA